MAEASELLSDESKLYGLANSLGGYVDESTPDDLTAFLSQTERDAVWLAETVIAERAARKAVEIDRDEARRQIEASGRVYGMVQQASSQVVAANVKLREVLIEAKAAVNLLEDLCACGADDDYVWDLQEKIDAALSPAREVK